jgi:hypothetical protein
MDAILIKPQKKSDLAFILDLANRIGVPAKAVNIDELEDERLIALIEKGLTTGDAGRDEVFNALEA